MVGILKPVQVRATRPVTSSIVERATNAATQLALKNVAAKIPAGARKHLPLARKLLTGGVGGLVDAGMDALFGKLGINGMLLPGLSAGGTSVLLGGITLDEARRRFEEHRNIDFAKKNLWCIRVRNVQGGRAMDINMLALDVNYPSYSVQGEPVLLGSGSFDNVTNSERREIRVTTLDDSAGSVKKWFRERHDAMCRADGTFGLPVDYVFRVDVLHAFIDETVDGAYGGWIDSYLMRPGTLDNDLSRRESGLQELQMTFVQWDTFGALA